jgi:hypothetical protein
LFVPTQEILRLIDDDSDVTIVSLKPTSLQDVADSFVTVASACGVQERGQKLRDEFLDDLDQLHAAIDNSRDKEKPKPTLLLLEWLDPPFDGGHWIPQMMERAGVETARPKVTKSAHIARNGLEKGGQIRFGMIRSRGRLRCGRLETCYLGDDGGVRWGQCCCL